MILPFVQIGNEFHFLGHRYKSMNAVQSAERALVAKAEKAAGRQLTVKELVAGVEHPEDRSAEQQRSDRAFHVDVVMDAPQEEVHAFDSADAAIRNRQDTREALNLRMRAQYDARITSEQPDPEAPRREQATAHAHDVLHSVMFDRSVPQSIVERAKQLVTISQRAPLDQYKADSEELIRRVADHKRVHATAIELKRAEALAELPQQFEPVEPMEPEPKPEPPFTWEQIKEEPDPAERHRMWTANEAVKNEAD